MSLNHINNQPFNIGLPYSSKRGFRLARRDSKSKNIESTISNCQANCPSDYCKKLCDVSNRWRDKNGYRLDKCVDKCGQDVKCGVSCYAEVIGITQSQYEQTGKLSNVAATCSSEDEKKFDECYAKALKVDTSVVKKAADCVNKECIRISEYKDFLQCSLKCNSKLLEKAPEPSKSSSTSEKETATQVESKTTKTDKPNNSAANTSSAKSFTKFSVGSTLLFTFLVISSII